MQKTIKPADRQALKGWENYIDTFLSTVIADTRETPEEQRKRIKKLEANFEDWKKYYFPNYCYSEPAKFHKQASRETLANPEFYDVRAWARELAKDAVCMFETLNQVLTRQKRNIILVSNSYDKAENLITPYRIELEFNERIINDYGVQKLPGDWQAGEFKTTGGASFLAIGAGQSPRGTRNEEVRPDKIIISDIDTDEDTRNTDIIDKRWQWIERALIPTRSVSKPLQVIFLGNIIAKDCCIVRAGKKADRYKIINIVDKNGVSAWPEKNTQANIERIKSKISTAAFEQEYMNNPISEGKVFKKVVWGKCPPLRSLPYVVVYSDPSPSNRENKQSSTKAVFVIGEKGGKFYIYRGWLDRTTAAKFVNWIYDARDYINDRTQPFFYVENNSLQDPFFQQVFKPLFFKASETRGVLAINGDNRKKPDKYVRIEGNLEPLVNNGQLILNEAERDNPHMQRLEEQFLLITPKLPAPADGVDCIEGGVFLINQKKRNNVDGVTVVKRTNKKY